MAAIKAWEDDPEAAFKGLKKGQQRFYKDTDNYRTQLQAEKTALQQKDAALQQKDAALQAEKTLLVRKDADLVRKDADVQAEKVLVLEKESEGRKKSAWEWLKGPEPEMDWVMGPSPSKKSKSSTSVPAFYAPDFVEPWPSFGSEVPESITGTMLTALQGDPKYEQHRARGANEGAVQDAITREVQRSVESIAQDCFQVQFMSSDVKQVYDPVGSTYRKFDHVIATEEHGPVLVIEDKTPTSFPSPDVVRYWRHASHAADENDLVQCPVTQLCMYLRLRKRRYGMLTTYDKSWFICLVTDNSGRHGIRATAVFSTKAGDRGNNPRGASLSQALLLATSLALSDGGTLSDDEWKPFTDSEKLILSKHQEEHQEASSKEEAKKLEQEDRPTRRPSTRTAAGKQHGGGRGGGGYDSLPLASVSAVLDMGPGKVVPILGGAGAGFKKQRVHGYESFIKLLSPALVDPDDAKELKHEAEMYQVLEPLWGSSVPGLVYQGALERGKFALITTDEGESLATEKGLGCARKSQGLLHSRAHEALNQLHGLGVLHGDVALRNVVVNSTGGVKVIDFGRSTKVIAGDPNARESFRVEHAQLDAELARYGLGGSGVITQLSSSTLGTTV